MDNKNHSSLLYCPLVPTNFAIPLTYLDYRFNSENCHESALVYPALYMLLAAKRFIYDWNANCFADASIDRSVI